MEQENITCFTNKTQTMVNRYEKKDNKPTCTKPSENPRITQRCQSLDDESMYRAAHTMPIRIALTGIR